MPNSKFAHACIKVQLCLIPGPQRLTTLWLWCRVWLVSAAAAETAAITLTVPNLAARNDDNAPHSPAQNDSCSHEAIAAVLRGRYCYCCGHHRTRCCAQDNEGKATDEMDQQRCTDSMLLCSTNLTTTSQQNSLDAHAVKPG